MSQMSDYWHEEPKRQAGYHPKQEVSDSLAAEMQYVT